MVRIVNKEEFDAKRAEILDSAQRLVLTKGYERMTLQDILSDLGMSNGAFYHYFPSKPAVLEALIERMLGEAEQPILAILHDPQLSALEKLQGFFATLERLRSLNKPFLVDLLRVWTTDDNALVRQKVETATAVRRAALLTEVIHQGIREGQLTAAYPDQAGEIIMALLRGMENTHARLFLSLGQEIDDETCVASVVAVYAAYMDTIERVIGLPIGTFHRYDAGTVREWVTALRSAQA